MTRRLRFKRHRFPPEVIRRGVWPYFRVTLSFRDVEEMLEERGIDVTHETIRKWTIKFGPQIARNLKRRRVAPSPRWHLDEVFCKIGGRQVYLWRAVDDEGEVLDVVVQKNRYADAVLRLLRRLLANQPVVPRSITTDGLRSYAAALGDLACVTCIAQGDSNRTSSAAKCFASSAAKHSVHGSGQLLEVVGVLSATRSTALS